jgi:RNA polymerase sigma-70 factor (ECF subfamily)
VQQQPKPDGQPPHKRGRPERTADRSDQTLDPSIDAWVSASLAQALGFARSLTGDADAAEDVVHDCYLRLLRKAGEYDLVRDGTKILMRAITNACINRWQRRHPTRSLDEPIGQGELAEVTRTWEDTRSRSPLEHAMAGELSERVGRLLGELPVLQRAALELKAMGHSLGEIAEALNIRSNHAAVLIHRARATLASQLDRDIEGSKP